MFFSTFNFANLCVVGFYDFQTFPERAIHKKTTPSDGGGLKRRISFKKMI